MKENDMCTGIVPQSEMPKFRKMVVELYDNLGGVPLSSDKLRLKQYIQTTRRFTQAEARTILDMHYNLKNPRKDKKHGTPGR